MTALLPAAPRLGPGLVERPRLVARLAATPAPPLVLLAAPAGYGKTTVLRQWTAGEERPLAWLTLGAEHDDDGVLVAAIARRLEAGGEPLPRRLRAALAAAHPPAVAALLPALLDALERRPPEVLVLDGLDALRSPGARAAVRAVAGRLAPGSTLALAARAEPDLPVGRLRAEQAVVELRGGDLAMTDDEAALLLRGAGLSLGPAAARALARRAEGWPAGLRLAALSLRDEADPGARAAAFGGDDRLVADYLRDEVLAGLAPADRDLLVRTAPLDVLSGPLCDAVARRRGSGDALRRLAAAGVPLVALDRAERAYRHHPLLADLLRAELRRADPDGEAEVHRLAGAWHEHHGDPERAIDHAIAAGDAARAAALVWAALGAHAAQGRSARVVGWLARLPQAELAARPELAVAAATVAVADGDADAAERWVEAAERALPSAPPARRGGLAAAAAVLRAAIGRDGLAAAAHDAARARALHPADTPWHALSCLLEGVARHLAGAPAPDLLEEAARRGAATAPAVQALALAQLALLAVEGGEWDQALDFAERALLRVERAGLRDDPPCALVLAAAAFLRAHRGSSDQARRDAAAARRLLDRQAAVSPWYAAETRIALARAELRLSDAASARALLADASRALRRVPDAVVLRAALDDAWARADAFAAGAVAGPSELTTAELRVLRFLPTHLSLREIAARLHVSANTVKTQAHSIYRKLDASSRSEAVARAREVGLVDGWDGRPMRAAS